MVLYVTYHKAVLPLFVHEVGKPLSVVKLCLEEFAVLMTLLARANLLEEFVSSGIQHDIPIIGRVGNHQDLGDSGIW
jgi:hypothetical protein